jgi:sugar phosphate isomerase/epimerase
MIALLCYNAWMFEKLTISLQLFSMRKLGPLDVQLREAARAGFKSVELLDHHLLDLDGLTESLVTHRLSAPSAHVSLDLLAKDTNRFVEACLRAGVRQVFVPHPEPRSSGESAREWQKLGQQLGSLAERLNEHGISLGYHNKTAGFTTLLTGRYGFEHMFSAARGSPLVWQADIAWLHRATGNPGEWLQRYREVLASAHIKDQAPEGSVAEDGWSDIGSGVLIWPSLWRTAVACGARLLVVEHDNPHDPCTFAARAITYLNRFIPIEKR